jgi:hypothetical protein
MRYLALFGSILFVSGISLTACSNPGSDMQGTWKMSTSGVDAGQMIVTPDSMNIYPSQMSTLLGGKQSSVKTKWKKSGNQITAIEETGAKETFTVLDRDHLNLENAGGPVLLTRDK